MRPLTDTQLNIIGYDWESQGIEFPNAETREIVLDALGRQAAVEYLEMYDDLAHFYQWEQEQQFLNLTSIWKQLIGVALQKVDWQFVKETVKQWANK